MPDPKDVRAAKVARWLANYDSAGDPATGELSEGAWASYMGQATNLLALLDSPTAEPDHTPTQLHTEAAQILWDLGHEHPSRITMDEATALGIAIGALRPEESILLRPSPGAAPPYEGEPVGVLLGWETYSDQVDQYQMLTVQDTTDDDLAPGRYHLVPAPPETEPKP